VPDVSGTLVVTYSFVPTVEVGSINLPELAVTAIEARAESMLLRIPGGCQNLAHALDRDRDFHRCISNLKSISIYGETGDLVMVSANFPGAP
jgi:hypothetical protein